MADYRSIRYLLPRSDSLKNMQVVCWNQQKRSDFDTKLGNRSRHLEATGFAPKRQHREKIAES